MLVYIFNLAQRQIRELNESLLKEKRKNDVIIIKRTQK